MASNSDQSEVYYCGKCTRQQRPSEGIKCKICGKITVSWHTDRESSADAHRKWTNING
jgi:DNA-directed RNA polymerase subunit M/transcription elongation factor TFIIS